MKIIVLFLSLFLGVYAFSESCKEIIDDIKELIDDRGVVKNSTYLKGFQLLGKKPASLKKIRESLALNSVDLPRRFKGAQNLLSKIKNNDDKQCSLYAKALRDDLIEYATYAKAVAAGIEIDEEPIEKDPAVKKPTYSIEELKEKQRAREIRKEEKIIF